MTEITGIDYLTGEDGIPIKDLNFVGDEEYGGSPFGRFAGAFARKYGVASSAKPPTVVTDESLETIRRFYARNPEIGTYPDRPTIKLKIRRCVICDHEAVVLDGAGTDCNECKGFYTVWTDETVKREFASVVDMEEFAKEYPTEVVL